MMEFARRRLASLATVLLAAATPAAAQNISLNSLFDAVKGIARSQEAASMSEQDEIAVGKQIAARTLGSYPVVRDEKLQRYLNAVGLWVALQSDRPELPWRFAAVESDQINAFAVPGGAILITRGLLKQLANEAELACVLGHEVGHVARKHHLSLLQKETLLQTGAKAVGDNLQTGGLTGQAQKLLVGEGAELFGRALDRDSEREADGDAVVLAARAGYDPGACLLFMQRLAGMKQEDGPLASLYKTHPQASERAGDIGKALERLEGVAPGSGARPAFAFTEAAAAKPR